MSALVFKHFDYQKFYNLKRTYRRLSCLVTRVLGNMGAEETTPLLERFSSPLEKSAAGEGRWTTGFYLDQAQEFDDDWFGRHIAEYLRVAACDAHALQRINGHFHQTHPERLDLQVHRAPDFKPPQHPLAGM